MKYIKIKYFEPKNTEFFFAKETEFLFGVVTSSSDDLV